MKVILANGSPKEKGCTYTALCEVAGALEKNGIEKEIFWVGAKPIAGCIGCGACAEHCPQRCIETGTPYQIQQEHCLHCGNCHAVCPVQAVERKTGQVTRDDP